MSNPLDLSLTNGPIPLAVTAVGCAALLYLCFDRRRVWWTRVLPIALVACGLVTAAIALVVDKVWRPFPEALPKTVLYYLGVVLFGLTIAVARAVPARRRTRVLVVLAGLAVLVAGLSGINRFYGQYPTTRAALGPLLMDSVDLDKAAPPVPTEVAVPPGQKLVDVWKRPADLPTEGTLSETDIPSSGGFQPRQAWIYLPPAYAASPRPRLPVVVLLSGQPGTPRDWLDAGQLAKNLDAFAAAHQGLAPIVVMADQLGSTMANPMCLDSKLGQVETYLARDVPRWITQRLQVNEDRGAWTIAGFSQGGTCAVQLAVRAPSVYAQFIDISGQREPTLGTRPDTVRAAFGGDDAAFSKVNPLEVMAKTSFPDTAGMIVAGQGDREYRPQDQEVFEACRKSGMNVQLRELPGATTGASGDRACTSRCRGWRPGPG